MSQPTLASPAPALAEIEEALVPALIVEKLEDGSYTVLAPSVPTPMAGAIYILPPERVHPVDVPFTVALKVFSKWGAGAGEFVRAMQAASPLPGRAVAGLIDHWLFTAARRSSAKFGMGQKALWNPFDSATAGVFCAAQQARSAVVRPLI